VEGKDKICFTIITSKKTLLAGFPLAFAEEEGTHMYRPGWWQERWRKNKGPRVGD
jgi:hypothetical protein